MTDRNDKYFMTFIRANIIGDKLIELPINTSTKRESKYGVCTDNVLILLQVC